ncbi:MAG: HupE/UreJ family protein [Rhodocyclaceae bacterium]|nr:HupE/UreJ family protein [Rhodocyclaceae bacterium]
MNARQFALGFVLTAVCGVAVAHPGHIGGSLFAGFAHPLSGLDHMLSMLAVGAFAAQQPGRAGRLLPAVFLLAMLAGAAAASVGLGLPWIEQGIAASMIVLGLLLARAAPVPVPAVAVAALVAGIAVLHGHAHYLEMGHQSVLGYALGFVAAAAGIQWAGHGLARWLPHSYLGRRMKRVLGGVVATVGALLLAG